jgi:phytoene dehydrogenase-like protein
MNDYDAVIVGGGLGGLLMAAQLIRRGERVLVLERRALPGGRFTGVMYQGAQLSTGALHLFPHGARGPLAQMLGELGIAPDLIPSDIFAAFHLDGHEFVCRHARDMLHLLTPGERIQAFTVLLRSWITPQLRRPQSFGTWLRPRVSPRLYLLYERFAEFALSITLEDLSYEEGRAVIQAIFDFGMPGIPRGGCLGVTTALVDLIAAGGGELQTQAEAQALLTTGRRVTGVRFVDRRTGQTATVTARRVITDCGPQATAALLAASEIYPPFLHPPHESLSPYPQLGSTNREARGFKLHVLSDVPLLSHRGILFCLDTRRIAGLVQVSNADPSLAPAGKHLIITYQISAGDARRERELALADLHFLFGERFERHCTILHAGQFTGSWPVNRAIQGQDLRQPPALAGLYLVGDGCKPAGIMMAEGVASSVAIALEHMQRQTIPEA